MEGAEAGPSLVDFHVLAQNNFDLTLMVHPQHRISFRFDYNANVYDEGQVERLKGQLIRTMEAMALEPSARISEISCLEPEEERQLLQVFGTGPAGATDDRPVTELFREQALLHPQSIAVRSAERLMTYGELDELSARLARHLTEVYRVKPGETIGIMLDRSALMPVALLGILRSGAAYVPVDPAYPRARKAFLLENSGAAILLTQTEYLFDIDPYTGTVLALDIQLPGMAPAAGTTHQAPQADSLAYIIYTSGSTGQPKGCCITHGNLQNYIHWANDHYFGGKAASFGLFTSLSFDLTVTSIYCTLTLGGTLTVYPQQAGLADILADSFGAESGVDSIKLTPSHINYLRDLNLSSHTMRTAIVGGEELTPEQVRVLKKIGPFIRIYNEYGPTETTVGCVVARVDIDDPVVIGRPLARTRAYILAEGDMLCPIGATGEICIGGAGVGQGYWDQPELTAQKFVADPFCPGQRMYRTGDLGRWQPDGNLVFAGRKDEQLKIRGYRIEPGEIARTLEEYPGVDEAAVLPVTDKTGEQELVAYVRGREGIEELKAWLSERLPAYLVPARFVLLTHWPLTENGKLDRSKLPSPESLATAATAAYTPPRNDLEQQLVLIWQEILGREPIGIRDNFFDAGGNSIRMVRLSHQLSNLLGREIGVPLLFEYPSIQALLDHLLKGPQPYDPGFVEGEELMEELDKFNTNE
jgi:amino acid adenylation domain-containing protein